MKWRVLSVLLAISVAGTFFGCEKNTDESSVLSEANGVTTISWWAFPTFTKDEDGRYEQKLIDEFEKEHEDIHVELKMLDFSSGGQKIMDARKKNNCCDLLFDAPGRIISYAKEGYLADMNDLFDEEFKSDISNSNLLDVCRVGDDYYMYPLSSAPFYMSFNKAYLEDAGVLDLVKEGWTVDDFTTVTTALREKGYIAGLVYCKNTAGDQGTRAFAANLYSASITNGNLSAYTTDSDKMIKSFEYIQQAVKDGRIIDGSEDTSADAISKFVHGRCSFTLLWSPNLEAVNQDELNRNNVETVNVPYPSNDGVAELEYLINGFCIFDNGDSDKIEASKEFLKFLAEGETGKDSVIHTKCIPVRNSFGVLYDDKKMTEVYNWQSLYGVYYNTIDGFSQMRAQWVNMLYSLISGEKTPKQCALFFTEQANSTIKEAQNE